MLSLPLITMNNNAKVKQKLEHERRVVRDMILLYCRKNHSTGQLCDDCRELAEYADSRTLKCPFMAEKSFCSQCKVHCYSARMRDEIRQVMRYSGPRMIFYHPIDAIRHLFYTCIEKLNSKKIIKK